MCSLQTDQLLPDGPVGCRWPQSKKPLCIYACAEPEPINLARGWVSWLRLCAAWICPPCIWIRAGPRPPSSACCKNTFLSVDKRCSKMTSGCFKGCDLWTHISSEVLSLNVALGVNKILFFKLLRCFPKIFTQDYLLIMRFNILWLSSVDRRFAAEVGKHFSFARHVLLYSCPCL